MMYDRREKKLVISGSQKRREKTHGFWWNYLMDVLFIFFPETYLYDLKISIEYHIFFYKKNILKYFKI